ncbi:hypothetical protein M409DRAFT_52161 [Zasmidium cellare ATCC 36951]|uniref:Uncharacterized protein n=1 Tax=Zasmidium cellare ATCC 36951 TaxID=1080233 RepID=A0A6A6CRD1_ZASCE|nr:uncharacterized protein M409DRAFT_52161 [Zasmidium cellare ATCC 36951]KAF2169641.1 hypothetical protein M409DRAFT_52161 [Zasmidium cellare ATCC 36951]
MSSNQASSSSNTTNQSQQPNPPPNVDAIADALAKFSISAADPPNQDQLATLLQRSHTFLEGLIAVNLFQDFFHIAGEYFYGHLQKPDVFHRIIRGLASEGHEALVDQFLFFIPADWEVKNERTNTGERVIFVKAPGGQFVEFGRL